MTSPKFLQETTTLTDFRYVVRSPSKVGARISTLVKKKTPRNFAMYAKHREGVRIKYSLCFNLTAYKIFSKAGRRRCLEKK
jgi:hypothetical protein